MAVPNVHSVCVLHSHAPHVGGARGGGGELSVFKYGLNSVSKLVKSLACTYGIGVFMVGWK